MPASSPLALIPLTLVKVEPGTSIWVNRPLLSITNPWVTPSASVNSPAMAFGLFPLTAVDTAPGTSTVVKVYPASATPGEPTSRPSVTAASNLLGDIDGLLDGDREAGVVSGRGTRRSPDSVAAAPPRSQGK